LELVEKPCALTRKNMEKIGDFDSGFFLGPKMVIKKDGKYLTYFS